jgi:hypothetical protein
MSSFGCLLFQLAFLGGFQEIRCKDIAGTLPRMKYENLCGGIAVRRVAENHVEEPKNIEPSIVFVRGNPLKTTRRAALGNNPSKIRLSRKWCKGARNKLYLENKGYSI